MLARRAGAFVGEDHRAALCAVGQGQAGASGGVGTGELAVNATASGSRSGLSSGSVDPFRIHLQQQRLEELSCTLAGQVVEGHWLSRLRSAPIIDRSVPAR